jgi:hypothetical protein
MMGTSEYGNAVMQMQMSVNVVAVVDLIQV